MNEHNQITLEDGHTIDLKELHQRSTYEGLLEGRPTSAENAQQVSRIVARELQAALGGAVHLIDPLERAAKDDPRAPGVKFGWLPRVTCIGRFISHQPARVPMCGSTLVIIWFQDSFSPSIAPEVLAELKRTPWSALAADFDY